MRQRAAWFPAAFPRLPAPAARVTTPRTLATILTLLAQHHGVQDRSHHRWANEHLQDDDGPRPSLDRWPIRSRRQDQGTDPARPLRSGTVLSYRPSANAIGGRAL